MTVEEKIKLLENRLQLLESNARDNQGACRKVKREIRNLKKLQEQ